MDKKLKEKNKFDRLKNTFYTHDIQNSTGFKKLNRVYSTHKIFV